jgi:hypothetical protein
MPETYGALTDKNPPIAKDCYPQYKHARTYDELKEISRQLDEARQDNADGQKNKLWEKKW